MTSGESVRHNFIVFTHLCSHIYFRFTISHSLMLGNKSWQERESSLFSVSPLSLCDGSDLMLLVQAVLEPIF